MRFVYILLCEDGSLYTGYSNDVEHRFNDHKNGKGGHYTRSHKPVKLIYQEQFNTQSEALKRERQIKGWSKEKKIRVLNLNLWYSLDISNFKINYLSSFFIDISSISHKAAVKINSQYFFTFFPITFYLFNHIFCWICWSNS